MNGLELLSKIESVCKARNVKMSELLKRAGLSAHLADDWKRGKTEPSFPVLFRICEVLDIEIEELFKSERASYTPSQQRILDEWKTLSEREREALLVYIEAMKGNHRQSRQ